MFENQKQSQLTLKQLRKFGLNPKEWLILAQNTKATILHKRDDKSFRILADWSNDHSKILNLELVSF